VTDDELCDGLLRLMAIRRLHPVTGAGGQMVGCESYRIVATGFALACLEEAAERIRSLRAENRSSEWQPIETAPKDGTSVLVVNGYWIITAHWHRSQCWATCGPTYEPIPYDELPTHWQPLPSPPPQGDKR